MAAAAEKRRRRPRLVSTPPLPRLPTGRAADAKTAAAIADVFVAPANTAAAIPAAAMAATTTSRDMAAAADTVATAAANAILAAAANSAPGDKHKEERPQRITWRRNSGDQAETIFSLYQISHISLFCLVNMATLATGSDSPAVVSEDRVCICGWPTDTVAIHLRARNSERGAASTLENECANPHTLILFVPGNPGVIHWYTDMLVRIVQQFGKSYSAHGVSYAGHGVGEDVVGTQDNHNQSFHGETLSSKSDNTRDKKQQTDMSIPWTMDGQVKHKIEWIDQVLAPFQSQSTPTLNLVFISHSIGAHLVQCILLRRPDILAKTHHVIHLMPFIRFDPPLLNKIFLSSAAQSYKSTIPAMTTLVRFLSATLDLAGPRGRNWIDTYLDKVLGLNCAKGRKIAMDTFLNPNMMRNHLVLVRSSHYLLDKFRSLAKQFSSKSTITINSISRGSKRFAVRYLF